MDAVEEIKNRLAIEDVIGQYVQLKRAGRNWKGLSPFTNERTPSFVVSPEKQIWHDFSSGKGGNVFSFVMEMEGLDFKGALELLARKAGVDLEQYRRPGQSGRGEEKERLYAALEAATHFYQVQFSKYRPALEYVLKKRAFSKETALEWRLGYSPETGTALLDFLKARGFSEREIKNAGLTAQRQRGLSDMFRGRIMVPLADPQGRIIGFTARLLKDEPNAPKYINTPQTPLYDKSRHVFGLHLAKEAIRKNKYVVLAEGNLDVIASHQAGVRQVVATAGTALTEWQLKTLGRFTPDVRLSFDADAAGLNATERAIPIASKVGVSLGIITIPSGKDPDELIRQDASKWQEIIEKHQYAMDWVIDRHQKLLDLTSAQGKKEFSNIVLALISKLPDQVEKEHYIDRVASLLHVSKEALLSKTHEQKIPPMRVKKVLISGSEKEIGKYSEFENRLLALNFFHPEQAKWSRGLLPDILIKDEARNLLIAIEVKRHSHNKTTPVDKLRPLEDYVKVLTLLYEELYKDVETTELDFEAERLQSRLIDRYIKTQKPLLDKAIEQILAKGGTKSPEYKKLHEKITKINSLRKEFSRGA